MKTSKYIQAIRSKDRFIDEYFNESAPLEISQLIKDIPKKSKAFSGILGNKLIDYKHLALLAVVLFRKRHNDLMMLRHSKNQKHGYAGANELLKLLNDYTEGKIALSGIRFDFKTINDKDGKRKSNEDIKSQSAQSIRISGNKMISGLMNSILEASVQEKTKVYASYINTPIFKPNEFPDRKADFLRKHNKIAAHALHPFFSSYKAIPPKERKILTMKVLVFMKFLEPYEQYKKQTEEKGKKALKETGYYLQRFNEFMR